MKKKNGQNQKGPFLRIPSKSADTLKSNIGNIKINLTKCVALLKDELSKSSQEETENLNGTVSMTEIEFVPKNLPAKSRHIGIHFFTCKDDAINSRQLIENREGENTLDLILYGQHYPDTKIRCGHYKEKKYRPVSLMNKD